MYNETDNSGRGFVWCKDLGAFGAIVHLSINDIFTDLAVTRCEVYACYAPANPFTGTWTWAKLTTNNMPALATGTSYLNNRLLYNRFQYAPALKSFFLLGTPSDPSGGIVCFRPLEIP
jgi:hypothetical protein